MGKVDVEVVVAAVVQHISWAAVRAGPSKHMSRLMGRAERPIYSPHLMGRGPARPIKIFRGWAAPGPGPSKFSEDGPRPGPAHENFRGWAAAQPSPSHFKFSPPGPAHQIFNVSARPGPAHDIFKGFGRARPVTIFRSARPGPDQTNGP